MVQCRAPPGIILPGGVEGDGDFALANDWTRRTGASASEIDIEVGDT